MFNWKKLVIMAISVLLAFTVLADAEGPDFYEVVDVKKGDVLNIRKYPVWKSEKIGEIPYDEKCVGNGVDWSFGLTGDEYDKIGTKAIEEALNEPISINGIRLLTTGEVIIFGDDMERYEQISKKRSLWIKVEYNNLKGWVHGRFLTESSNYNCD